VRRKAGSFSLIYKMLAESRSSTKLHSVMFWMLLQVNLTAETATVKD